MGKSIPAKNEADFRSLFANRTLGQAQVHDRIMDGFHLVNLMQALSYLNN